MAYEVYDDKSGQARWRLKVGNGQIVASSGEPFSSVAAATTAADELPRQDHHVAL